MPHIGNFPAPGYPKPLVFSTVAFGPTLDTQDWTISGTALQNRASLEMQVFYAPVLVPHGSTVKKLSLYGFRDDAVAGLYVSLQRRDLAGAMETMADVYADWTTGDSSGYDDTINYPVIDNDNYRYCLAVSIDPNDSVYDVMFRSAVIEWE